MRKFKDTIPKGEYKVNKAQYSKVANRVEEYRKKVGLSRASLGIAVDVSACTIQQLEIWEYKDIHVGIALKLARFFEVPVEELFMLDEEVIKKLT